MKFTSTRNRHLQVTLSEAIRKGLSPDGGLYVPEFVPTLSPGEFADDADLSSVGVRLLEPFFTDDALSAELPVICREAFSFETPVVRLGQMPGPASALELFHGPTCAFKDVGARFLAAAFRRLERGQDGRVTIFVATSGDTGGAVAAAFHNVEPFDVVLLYPKGLVSSRQAQQLSCWDGNIRTFAVHGTFDDCQRLVKQALNDPELARTHRFSSANSINLARLLPQMVYHALASLTVFRETRRKVNFIVPTGNLGNTVACVWARAVGMPIGEIAMATNENSPLPEYLARGEWRPRPTRGTIASAMDVGDPSNMERLRLSFSEPDEMRGAMRGICVSEAEIRETIRSDFEALGRVWCPHSATAANVYRRVWATRPDEPWIIVATAHPAKFNDVVEPLVGPVPVPAALDALLKLPRRDTDLEPSLTELRMRIQ